MSRNFTPEATLIDRLLIDNTEAFEEIHHRYCLPLYSYCIKKLHSPDDARRIVSNIFISLWERRHILPTNFSLSIYFYTSVRKSVIERINEKLEFNNDLAFIENQVIPEFAVEKLQQAKQPVRKIYLDVVHKSTLKEKKLPILLWRKQSHDNYLLKYLKLSLQKAFNLL